MQTYKIEDFKVTIVVGNNPEFIHKDYGKCYCRLETKDDIKKNIHLYVDGKHNILWSDGDPEEAATKIYVVFKQLVPVILENLEMLIQYVNRNNYYCDIYSVLVEDNLI